MREALVILAALCMGCGARSDLEAGVLAAARPCRVARPTVLGTPTMPGINAIVLDATHVYASFDGDGTLIKVPKAGGQVTVLAHGHLGLTPFIPGPLAVSDGMLYWGDVKPLGIFKVPTAGGPSSMITQANEQFVIRMVVTGGYAYWTGTDNAVQRVPISGGPPELLELNDGDVGDIATDGTNVFWSVRGPGMIRGIRIGLIPTGSVGSISRPLAYAVTTDLATVGSSPGYLATDGAFVVWASFVSPQQTVIQAVPIAGGDVITLATVSTDPTPYTTLAGTVVPATDGGEVYWTVNQSAGSISKAPLGNGDAVTVASGQDRPLPVAVDEACVYWADASSVMIGPR
jgi:hypothetical protein